MSPAPIHRRRSPATTGRDLWGICHILRRVWAAPALSGTLTCAALGGTFDIRDGRFNLFTVDPQTGMRQMVYAFHVTAKDGLTYYLHGHKEISDDRGQFNLLEDMTRLFITVYRGAGAQAPIYGAGELYFTLADGPALVASMEMLGATSWRQRLAALTAFASFAFGAVRDEYMQASPWWK
jgi:hypothetical protein